MKSLEEELNRLYLQKKEIESKIIELENSIKTQKNIETKELNKDEKISLFNELFVSRYDIYLKNLFLLR